MSGLLYDKLMRLANQREDWKPKELRAEFNQKFRIEKKDYKTLIRELQEQKHLVSKSGRVKITNVKSELPLNPPFKP